jgi:hypothetical protein
MQGTAVGVLSFEFWVSRRRIDTGAIPFDHRAPVANTQNARLKTQNLKLKTPNRCSTLPLTAVFG